MVRRARNTLVLFARVKLSQQRVPDVLVAGNEPDRRRYDAIVENLHFSFIVKMESIGDTRSWTRSERYPNHGSTRSDDPSPPLSSNQRAIVYSRTTRLHVLARSECSGWG
jgi:hypothetical protein